MTNTYICPICGKLFTPCHSSLKRFESGVRKHLYCSRACSFEAKRTSVIKECSCCGKKIKVHPSELKKNNFCSHSCAAIFNNQNRKGLISVSVEGKSIMAPRSIKCCIVCGNELNKGATKYCSSDCQNVEKYNVKIEKWKSGEFDGLSGRYYLSQTIKRYMLEKAGYKCEECGFSGVNRATGNTILEVHHIDGDYRNNDEHNLQVLCPNCHAMTETYKANNKFGRKERSKYKLINYECQ